jgi:hypothetical protein
LPRGHNACSSTEMIIRPAFYGFNNIKINPIKFSLSSRHCAPHRQQQICTVQCVLFSLSLSPANTIIICRAAPLAASALLFHIGFPPATLLLASPVIICSCKNALYPLSVHTHIQAYRTTAPDHALEIDIPLCRETFSPWVIAVPREHHAWRASFHIISIHLIELCYASIRIFFQLSVKCTLQRLDYR